MWENLYRNKRTIMPTKKFHTATTLSEMPLFAPEQVSKQFGISMILAPHPDDEALGCAGLIQYLLEQNTPVFVCFVTSGDASHPNSKKYPGKILAELRENEAKKACEILGVQPSHVFFLKQPDSLLNQLDEEEKQILVEKLSTLMETNKISSLVVPWRRDPHSDHKISYQVGKEAAIKAGREIQLAEYPIWLWKNSHQEDWPLKKELEIFRLDIKNKLPKKREAIFAHLSQTSKLIQDDPRGFILTEDLLQPFLVPYEFYFFEKDEAMSSLSEEYFDRLYAQNPDPWNFRKSEYEKSKYNTIDEYLENYSFKNGLEIGCSIGLHTSHLANHCESLLAVDVSEKAIREAKKNIVLPNVKFEVRNIVNDFPVDTYQFISMCELGYYFNRKTLLSLFENISQCLEINGYFLMVHWTSYVREYPLNGKLVGEIFQDFNKPENTFTQVSSGIKDRYELFLWKKVR